MDLKIYSHSALHLTHMVTRGCFQNAAVLGSFAQHVNAWMVDLRAGGYKLEDNTAVIAELIAAHNKILVDKFEINLGVNLTSLAPVLDLSLELKKRSDAVYAAVKNKVDEAKRIEAEKSAVDAAQQVRYLLLVGCRAFGFEPILYDNDDSSVPSTIYHLGTTVVWQKLVEMMDACVDVKISIFSANRCCPTHSVSLALPALLHKMIEMGNTLHLNEQPSSTSPCDDRFFSPPFLVLSSRHPEWPAAVARTMPSKVPR